MENKQVQYKIKGMNRDLSESTISNDFSYENKNIRITASDKNTLLSVTNEKGTKDLRQDLLGTPIGCSVLDNNIIIFTADSIEEDGETYSLSRIYKYNEKSRTKLTLLYEGESAGSHQDLNFDINHPIEALGFYENEKVKKVYWVDGINLPRVINIEDTNTIYNSNSFDFSKDIVLNHNIKVSRLDNSNGIFKSGVIQYAFTYYNEYGTESNIFHISPINYISFYNRGAKADEVVNCGFNISLENLDTNFLYVRIYSIHRTSLNSIPTIKRVVDLLILGGKINFIDLNTLGEIEDPKKLLYVGGKEIIANTLTQKDNTLFLGNILNTLKVLSLSIKDSIKAGYKTLTYFNDLQSKLVNPIKTGNYVYENLLSNDASDITTFKYLETYRLGLLFLYSNGNWSDVAWIGDKTNDTCPPRTDLIEGSKIKLAKIKYTLSKDVITNLLSENYVKVRPVIVYPTLSDRSVICQGVVCPTVFNANSRNGNSPFSLSSWFWRPNAPIEFNGNTNVKNGGVIAEFRHFKPIPGNNKLNSEIQCIYNPSLLDTNGFNVGKNSSSFYIDLSIITMHSPEAEFNSELQNINFSKLKFRIIGAVPITSVFSDMKILTASPALSTYPYYDGTNADDTRPSILSPGFYYENFNLGNLNTDAYRTSLSSNSWVDLVYYTYPAGTRIFSLYLYAFTVYPFHRHGPLNNLTDGEYKTAMLKSKHLIHNRFSYNTHYMLNLYLMNTSDILFFSEESKIVKLNAKLTSSNGIIYSGNIDNIITFPMNGATTTVDKVSIGVGYPIMSSSTSNRYSFDFLTATLSLSLLFNDSSRTNAHTLGGTKEEKIHSIYSYSSNPVLMKYKSSNHLVLAFDYNNNNLIYTLPTASTVSSSGLICPSRKYFWDDNPKAYILESIPVNSEAFNYGWLWLGEIYRDTVENRFGGNTEDALLLNIWTVGGKDLLLPKNNTDLEIIWDTGDTYYQRYDCLKTYPANLDDENAISDTLSFMCETHINIDGRCDRNRGDINNYSLTPLNFNLMNNVYSLRDNYFNYRYFNSEREDLNVFKNTITWTLSKTAGELVDSWTNITLANTLDLDGDLGGIKALRRFNNNIYFFLDKGLGVIKYNSNVLIAPKEGTPIEIANSGKVDGKDYISEDIGCLNKWSICSTSLGIYFIDDLKERIFRISAEGLLDLSTALGFNSWVKNNTTSIPWVPGSLSSNIVTYYDKLANDVLFISDNDCLAFSETLSLFSSFFNYEKITHVANIKDHTIALRKPNKLNEDDLLLHPERINKYGLWELHAIDKYNNFFGEFKPFYVNYIVNPDPTLDKIFTNVEYRADFWNRLSGLWKLTDTTFDTLRAYNEYLDTKDVLIKLLNPSRFRSELREKFRIWRAIIPRDKKYNRDRIRNPWIYLKLCKSEENYERMELHDTIVKYFL